LSAGQVQAGRWGDEVRLARPLSTRSDLSDFEATSARAANDDAAAASRAQPWRPPAFVGSRHFWAALVVSAGFSLILALLAGFGSREAVTGLLRDPTQHATFLIAVGVVVALQWVLAFSAHRQLITEGMWRRLLLASQRDHESHSPNEKTLHKTAASIETLFAGIDDRMLAIEERMTQLSQQVGATLQQSSDALDENAHNIRSINEVSEAQREALQRAGVMIMTEVMPVVAHLESATIALESVSQSAGVTLEGVGGRLERSTLEFRHCLEVFSRADFTVVPEIERRMARLEAMISRLPDQLGAAIDRVSPLSDTMTQAAMLSAANVDVLGQCAQDIAANVGGCRDMMREFSASSGEVLRNAVSAHAGQFRELLHEIVQDESTRLAELSRELGHLGDTVVAVLERLRQPVSEVNAVAELALAGMSQSVSDLEDRVRANLNVCIAQMNDTAARIVSSVGRDMEAATTTLQSRIAGNSAELVQRFGADTSRLERAVADATDRTANRVGAIIRDLPPALAQRMESEVARIDGSLKISVVGLSDHMRQALDEIPGRLSGMARDMVRALESDMENSLVAVAQKSGRISNQFRTCATETTEAVLESYVDFIFIALERFRRELKVIESNPAENGPAHNDRPELSVPLSAAGAPTRVENPVEVAQPSARTVE